MFLKVTSAVVLWDLYVSMSLLTALTEATDLRKIIVRPGVRSSLSMFLHNVKTC